MISEINLLIVEDDQFKLGQIQGLVEEVLERPKLYTARSVASGKDMIRRLNFNLILLDMSLPSFDIDQHEPGGTPQTWGGREILGYLDFYDLEVPVVVVTQFERFWTGTEDVDITNLGVLLKSQYPTNFSRIVYFNTASERWKKELREILSTLQDNSRL